MNPPTQRRDKVLAALTAMANDTRLDLIRALIGAGEGGIAAGVLARQIGVAGPRLSFHLSTLEQAGLITAERVSRNIFYRADPAALGRVIGYLLNDCCCAHPKVSACCKAAAAAPDAVIAQEP